MIFEKGDLIGPRGKNTRCWTFEEFTYYGGAKCLDESGSVVNIDMGILLTYWRVATNKDILDFLSLRLKRDLVELYEESI